MTTNNIPIILKYIKFIIYNLYCILTTADSSGSLGTVATLVYDCDIPEDGHQKGAETFRIV
jgi:hypothetical protein